jgi:hypothetical protein
VNSGDPGEHCSWNGFGPESGDATISDCFGPFIRAREMYGVAYNRLVIELAQVKAFAQFLKDRPSDLCNWVSNPIEATLASRTI